ncbi:flagellar assembly protein FliH [Pantoea agglomerans]|uniref:Flagellar assembly protein H n=1 Tax=Enterobacter agglomerans TaxID=549 RepID=A0ACC5RJ74_ENTAG|nr:flagellar assembly protein FliH [Pantoea agglomerans]MBK4724658.1 flagellar assembly protein H [Pantoea agglomerans]
MSGKNDNSNNNIVRRHPFQPLRKPWSKDKNQAQPEDTGLYQQQLMAGFQQGVSDGFEQGMAQGKEQGYQDGLARGSEEGMRLGREDGKRIAHTEFMLAARPLENLVAQMQSALDEHEERRRNELLQLVEKVTRQVIRCELALQPGQLLALVEEALGSLPEAPKRLRVLLNPEEFARISESETSKVKEWGLTADPDMAAGECKIITESAEMDVGCAHRLEQCMDVLSQSLSQSQDESDQP